MRFVTYNIQYGKGKDERFDLPRIAKELEGADVIALQEVEAYWTRSGMCHQAEELAKLLGDYYWVFGAGVDLHVQGDAPTQNRRRQFGNMLLSKSPILSSRHHLLPKYATVGAPMSIQRSAQEVVINTAQGPIRVYSVHLTHLSAETRIPQIERLLDINRDAPLEGIAITGDAKLGEWVEGMPKTMPREAILMGDFNCIPGSIEYEALVGPLSEYGGRMNNPEGFVDAWVMAGHEEDDGVTADILMESVRLDYMFVSASLRERIKKVWIDTEAQGSDHQPVWMDIDL